MREDHSVDRLQLPSFRVDGQLALITGASAGIGAGIAIALARAGADVVLLARNQENLGRVARRIEEIGGRATHVVCDVTDTPRVRKVIAELSRLDILINNAGINIPEPLLAVTDEHLDWMLNLNVRAAFVVAQAAVRKMLEDKARSDKGGAIVNISSTMGHVGGPDRTVYCMTKHAIEGLTKALAVELAGHRIRTNSIAPTFIETPLFRRIADTPQMRDFIIARVPLGMLATVEDVMAAAVYLASPAAAMITGTHLIVDGGWTAQ